MQPLMLTRALAFMAGAGLAFSSAALQLPPGFEATVFHDGVGKARHIAAAPNGDLFVRLGTGADDPGLLRLRDTDSDGRADRTERLLSDAGGTGVEIGADELFFSTDTAVHAIEWAALESGGISGSRAVVGGFPEQRQHAAKSLALAPDGTLFVNVGAPSNACQKDMRTPGSPGLKPCPQLEWQAGVWRFGPDAQGGSGQSDGSRYVTGLRNAVALAWNPAAGKLFLVQHGRDQLHGLWQDHFSVEENARLPAEEFHAVGEGSNLGWPFTYYDGEAGQRVQAPEYGGDGEQPAGGEYAAPLVAFPAHWAPNDLLFYSGSQFPEKYRNAAFVAFHGSWNRAPLPQAGFNVAAVPMNAAGEVTGEWHVFADGFAGGEKLASPREARFRPTGLAQGPDGSLFVVDSVKGRIWKIQYSGAAAD